MSAALNGVARLGVPQGYQVHILLPGGRTQLERFFVDATGRGSRLPDWLELGGRPRPETERLPADIR